VNGLAASFMVLPLVIGALLQFGSPLLQASTDEQDNEGDNEESGEGEGTEEEGGGSDNDAQDLPTANPTYEGDTSPAEKAKQE